ncbi:MAG: HAMP domain-containing sensor histidine kinase [Actinomycetota bacterium]
MGIRGRVVLVAVVTAVVVVSLVGVLAVRNVERELRRSVDRQLIERAETVAPALAALSGRPATFELLGDSSVLAVGARVETRTGDLVELGDFPSEVAIPEQDRISDEVADGRPWRVLTIRFDPAGPVGTTTLQFASSLVETERQIEAIRTRILVLAAVSLAGAAVVGLVAGSVATRSLRGLAREAAELRPATDPGRRVDDDRGLAEVDELARALNSALDRVAVEIARTDAALEASRSFTADAAHELSTPLTSMGTDLEVLGAHPDLPAGERAEIVAELRQEHQRLLDLLAMLRELARGDQQSDRSFEPVDLSDVVDEAVDALRRRRPGLPVSASLPDVPAVSGWRPGLRVLVDNLLTNAVVHGGDGVAIDVVVSYGEGSVRVAVSDDGPGFPSEDRTRLLERFERGSTGEHGSGLGLALVVQQAELHGGTVELRDAEPRGAHVVVELPVGASDG